MEQLHGLDVEISPIGDMNPRCYISLIWIYFKILLIPLILSSRTRARPYSLCSSSLHLSAVLLLLRFILANRETKKLLILHSIPPLPCAQRLCSCILCVACSSLHALLAKILQFCLVPDRLMICLACPSHETDTREAINIIRILQM